jgi:hypothetical protein
MSQSSTKPEQTPSESTPGSATTLGLPSVVVLEIAVPVPYQALADLVRRINVQELEAIALARLGWGDEGNVTYYIVQTIADVLEAMGNAD